MKRIIYTTIVMCMLTTITHAQFFQEIVTDIPSIPIGGYNKPYSIKAGDYDNDGDFDIIISKLDYYKNVLYRCESYSNYTKLDLNIDSVCYASGDWADFNNDRNLDFYLRENNTEYLYINIYNIINTFKQTYKINASLKYGFENLADYNNDGLTDLLVLGSGKIVMYKNHDTIFTKANEYLLNYSSNDYQQEDIASGDLDNDGDIDFILYDRYTNIYIYKNELYNFDKDSIMDSSGGYWDVSTCELGDMDNDGDLDLIANTGGGGIHYLIIYENIGESNFIKYDTLEGLNRSVINLGDLDNDGNIDIYLTDYSSNYSRIYLNKGSHNFVEITDTTSDKYSGPGTIADLDQDGDLDIFQLAKTDPSKYEYYIYQNDSAASNTAPSVPDGLSFEQVDDYTKLSWNRSTDDHTPQSALSYNVYIGTTKNSVDIVSPMADISTGLRRVTRYGNAQLNNFYLIKYLEPGITYYWSVQALDNAFVGSAFAPVDSFTVNYLSTFQVSDSILCFNNSMDTYDTLDITYTGNAPDTASFYWNFDDGTILSGSGSGPYKILWNTSGEKNVSLVVECNGYVSDTSKQVINVNPVIIIDLGSDRTICQGTSIQINAEVTGGTAPYEYVWSTSSNDSSITVSPTYTTTYSITVTDAKSCALTDQITVNIQTAYEDEEICMVTVDNSTGKNMVIWEKTPGKGTNEYYVYKESSVTDIYNLLGAIPYDSLSIFIDTTSDPQKHYDRYKIASIDSCGNISEKSDYHQSIYLSISQGALPNTYNLLWTDYVGFSYSSYYVYKGYSTDNLLLIDSVSSSHNAYTDVDSVVTYYQVGAKKSSPCLISKKKSTAEPYTQTVSNMEDNSKYLETGIHPSTILSGLNIFPNPAKEQLNIEFYLSYSSDISIEIFNILGEKVYNRHITDKKAGWYRGTITADELQAKAGIYYINIKVKNYSSYTRIIIE